MKRLDLTGQKFGRLTVIEYSHTDKGYARWKCECECGNTPIVRAKNLRSGCATSCGCYNKEVNKKNPPAKKHGLYKIKIYSIWNMIKSRCYNKNNKRYKDWGGRGITMCEEWRNDFVAFKEWALSNGYSDDLTIDRIDNNGNYEPENCRWATYTEQANNTSANHCLSYNGKTQSIALWSREVGLTERTLAKRIRRGWSIEEALTKPIKLNKNENS